MSRRFLGSGFKGSGSEISLLATGCLLLADPETGSQEPVTRGQKPIKYSTALNILKDSCDISVGPDKI
jgi:hypothetical protein